MITNIKFLIYLLITAISTTSSDLTNSPKLHHEHELMVVLPVLQGRNISGEKLQYVYTKPPVTMWINDAESTSIRPTTPFNPWPSNFASKAQVFLVEPSIRRTSNPHPYPSIEWLKRINAGVAHTEAPTSWKTGTMPTNIPTERMDLQADMSVSKVSWKKSTDHSAIKWLTETTDILPTMQPSNFTVDANPESTIALFTEANSSHIDNVSNSDGKTVAQLAFDVQESTNKLTNDIKSMLLHLGLLTQGISSQSHGDSNELGLGGTEGNTSNDVDTTSYTRFKNIPVSDELAIRDDMRHLLNTFGLIPEKNDNQSSIRVTRETKVKENQPSDVHKLFKQQADGKMEQFTNQGNNHQTSMSTNIPLKRGLDYTTRKPWSLFNRRTKETIRTRAINSSSTANKVQNGSESLNRTATASAEQLSGSFGGEASEEQSSSPKAPQNGLYFWVDWNSFFNVTGDPNVQVQYSSQAGDPTKFIPINHISRL